MFLAVYLEVNALHAEFLPQHHKYELISPKEIWL